MKKGIIGILNNPAVSLNSHSAGMVFIVSKLFEADILTEKDNWNDYDELIIYHGVNFKKGSFNVIGGINKDVMIRVNKYLSFKGTIHSLDGFNMKDFALKRKLDLDMDIETETLINLPFKAKMVIGDSHSVSVWPDNSYGIIRNDGKTLFGFLKTNTDLSIYEDTILYFGNIDLRFHLCRQVNPILATKDLFNRYVDYAYKYNSTIVNLLPVETESRKIPGTGKYKGQNFFGSKEQRKELRLIANEIMNNSGLNVLKWPNWFCDEKGDMRLEIMEPKQSVHIRPRYYQRNINNNFEKIEKQEWTLF